MNRGRRGKNAEHKGVTGRFFSVPVGDVLLPLLGRLWEGLKLGARVRCHTGAVEIREGAKFFFGRSLSARTRQREGRVSKWESP
jgi:hypothetical protein